VKTDWHGHNDRGLALVNAIWALECGVHRVHGTALGIGERVGNAAMELILLNLKLLGLLEEQNLERLMSYCQKAADAVGWEVPINYPLVGRDAFRTATGVHAAAIIKAKNKGDDWLADRVYSGVPAGMFGRSQEIGIGYMSGASNVNFWLRQRGIEPTPALVDAILARAKGRQHNLTDDEIREAVASVG
jgi:2-isopropylmalate synthase